MNRADKRKPVWINECEVKVQSTFIGNSDPYESVGHSPAQITIKETIKARLPNQGINCSLFLPANFIFALYALNSAYASNLLF